jgi:hypothetical protein
MVQDLARELKKGWIPAYEQQLESKKFTLKTRKEVPEGSPDDIEPEHIEGDPNLTLSENSAEDEVEDSEIYYVSRSARQKAIHVRSEDDPTRSACVKMKLAGAKEEGTYPSHLFASGYRYCGWCRDKRPTVMSSILEKDIDNSVGTEQAEAPDNSSSSEVTKGTKSGVGLNRKRIRVK